MTNEFRGGNYAATCHLDLAEIAKLVRADIKAAQRDATLPADAVFRVRIQRYSMGQSLNVDIDTMPDTWTYNHPGQEPDYPNNIAAHGGHTPAAKAAVGTVEQIVNSYNRSRRDYQLVHFYSNVTIRDEHSQQFWAKEAARKTTARGARASTPTAGPR